MPEKLMRLGELAENPRFLTNLAYPSQDLDYAKSILSEFEGLGVEGVYRIDEPKPSLRILGKGYRGLVVKVRVGGMDAAAKILRTDAGVESLEREAEMTKLANSVGVGPRVLGYSTHTLLLEYIEGIDIDVWLRGLEEDRADILARVLTLSLEQARRLDEIGLDHGELSNARRHVFVRGEAAPIILDFGKASTARRPGNVTAFFSYITHGPHHQKILRMLGVQEPPLWAAREYKRSPNLENFNRLLQALNLARG